METFEKIELVLSHIQHVQDNCYKLGMKLIKIGEVEMGRILIANGQIHDNSKFKGIEFDHLFHGDSILSEVVKHHSSTNAHHPEFWGHIKMMPPVYIAEMVCDCAARSAEFGTNVHDFFKNVATKKYDFTMEDEVGKKISYFLSLLLQQPFSNN